MTKYKLKILKSIKNYTINPCNNFHNPYDFITKEEFIYDEIYNNVSLLSDDDISAQNIFNEICYQSDSLQADEKAFKR